MSEMVPSKCPKCGSPTDIVSAYNGFVVWKCSVPCEFATRSDDTVLEPCGCCKGEGGWCSECQGKCNPCESSGSVLVWKGQKPKRERPPRVQVEAVGSPKRKWRGWQ